MPISSSNRRSRKKQKTNNLENTQGKKTNQKIVLINKKINSLKDNQYIQFIEYTSAMLSRLSNDISRKNFKDRSDYSIFKDNNSLYFTNIFLINNNNSNNRLFIKHDFYSYINKTFYVDTTIKLIQFLDEINISIDEQKYNPVDIKSLYNVDKFNESLEILDIYEKTKISFIRIKEQFEKKIEFAGGNRELKNKINKAFILIRDQYEDYLKTYIQKTIDYKNPINDEILKENYISDKSST